MSEAKPPSRGLSKDISLDKMPETLGDNAYEVIIPPDSLPGDILRVTAGGKDYKITVPEGAEPGMALVFEGSKKKPVEPPADAPGEATQQRDPAKPMRRKSSLSLLTPRGGGGENGLIRATVAAAKNVGRQLSFQRRRKPVSSVPADAVRITKAQPVEAEVVAIGDKLPAELSPALPDQFSKVELKDKTYWKFVIPPGWVEGVEVAVEMPSRLKLHWKPPAGAAVGQSCAFLAPRSEGIAIASGNDDLKGIGDVVEEKGILGAAAAITKKVGRQLSFSRRKKPNARNSIDAGEGPVFREVDVYKPKGESLGVSLAYPADASQEGVVVTSLSPGGLVAKGKRVKAGDSVHAVNGVKVTSVEHATELLKQAEGIVQLVITRANALPKGWVEKTEGGATFWIHAASDTKSYSHPAAIRHNADDNPITLGDRFRGAVKKLQMIQSLAKAGEEAETVEGPEASEPAFVQVQRTTRI